MSSTSTTTPTTGSFISSASTTFMSAKLIGVQWNLSRPVRRFVPDNKTGNFVYSEKRIGVSEPTKCLFLADDKSFKWVAVNSGVFPGRWSMKDTSHLVFPPFPAGSDWNVGQIRRLPSGEIGFTTELLKKRLEGVHNLWHPTLIEFSDFIMIGQFNDGMDGRLWHAKHAMLSEKPFLVKIQPWGSNFCNEAIENETRAYQRIYGLGLAPEFLAHVTYRGAIIGFALEWIEGAETSKKEDAPACVEALKKLHALGITHGSAHQYNFLKRGDDMLMIDFESARFGDEATDKLKEEDIRNISEYGDGIVVSDGDEDDFVPLTFPFFDDFVDDEINWSDDSAAAEAEEEEEEEVVNRFDP
ncbi:hypothetical protein F5Y10DRAFT_280953 [Nemania abortiva]|nr:hypothetical protein F5Y10DRAFT_280953 [Nemania abortiva]